MPRPLGSQAGLADFSGHHLRLSKRDVGWFAVYFNLISCRYPAELPLSSNWNPTAPGIYTLEVNSDSYDNIVERLAKRTEINNFSNQRAI